MKGKLNQWNLTPLYDSPRDPRLEKDMRSLERAAAAFNKKYAKNASFIKTEKALRAALRDYEKTVDIVSSPRAWWYMALASDIDTNNHALSAQATKYKERLIKASNALTFFPLTLGKISPADQRKYLASAALAPYRFALETTFESAKHMLSESEENLLSLVDAPARDMWMHMTQRAVNNLTVAHKGETIPVSKARSIIANIPNARERAILLAKTNEALKTVADEAGAELNALVTLKKVTDEKRGFPHPYSSVLLSHQTSEATVMRLVALVQSSKKISHRFYKLHAKILGMQALGIADINAPIAASKHAYDFKTAAQIVRESLGSVDPEYARHFDRYLDRGRIDVYPRTGKRGGGYCWAINNSSAYILLNHTDDARSVETLGHEMGHAIHHELSSSQPTLYRDHSLAVAETASTFFEEVTFNRMLGELSGEEKIAALHRHIADDMATIFRQIACFSFELELHERIRKDGELPSRDIALLMAKHLQDYLGPAVRVAPDDGYIFVSWPHLRDFFYVYTYAYGSLVSRALYARWKADPAFAAKVRQFLSAGSSNTPEHIFKSIGIDVNDPAFFEGGLKDIERSIDELEMLAFPKK